MAELSSYDRDRLAYNVPYLVLQRKYLSVRELDATP